MSNRRKFLQNTASLVGGSMLASAVGNQAFALVKNRVAPSDQLNIGAIGINGMGWSDVTAALKVPGINLVAVCDVDKNVLDKRRADMVKMNVDPAKVKPTVTTVSCWIRKTLMQLS